MYLFENKNYKWRWLAHVCLRNGGYILMGGSVSIKGMQCKQVNIILIYLCYFSFNDLIRWCTPTITLDSNDMV